MYRLVPLTMLKYKIASVKIIAVPFRVLSQNIIDRQTNYVRRSRPLTEILVPFRGSFQKLSTRSPVTFIGESPLGSLPALTVTHTACYFIHINYIINHVVYQIPVRKNFF